MPRRRIFGQRDVQPDPRHHDKVVGKFINMLMSGGKKSTAEQICFGAFDVIQEKSGNDPLKVFRAAIDNVRPVVEVKSRRVGGASYQVPVEIRPVRRMSLALRWIAQYADNRKGVRMAEALAQEIKDAATGQGNAIKKREDTHKMAQANRAFAHFRW